MNVFKTFAQQARPYKDATNQLWHSTRAHNGIYWLSSAACPRGLWPSGLRPTEPIYAMWHNYYMWNINWSLVIMRHMFEERMALQMIILGV